MFRMDFKILLRHKWKLFFLSALIKIVAVSFFAFSTGVLPGLRSIRNYRAEETQKEVTFDEYISGHFSAKSFYVTWLSDAEFAYESSQSIWIRNLETNSTLKLISADKLTSVSNLNSWTISPDRDYVMITYNLIDGYAHYVRTFSWLIYDVNNNEFIDPGMIGEVKSSGIQKFKWSNHGHQVAFVTDFNLFLSPDFKQVYQLSQEGRENAIFNGIADWLYVEEIVEDDALFWWSPNDDIIAWATINDEEVHQFEFSVFDNQYPTMVKLPYPKPGTPIPKVHLNVARLLVDPIDVQPLQGCLEDFDGEFYLNSAIWRNDLIFSVTFKNRIENISKIVHYSSEEDFVCRSNQEVDLVGSTTGWIGHYKPHDIFPMSSTQYATVNSYQGFPHIEVVTWQGEGKVTKEWRTSGKFEVTDAASGYQSIHFYDNQTDLIYFTSTEQPEGGGQGLPRIRHLWSVRGNTDDVTRKCVTCHFNDDFLDRCNWVTSSFSHDGSYVIINCGGSSRGVPISLLLGRKDEKFEVVEVVEDNEELLSKLEDYRIRETSFGSIKLEEENGEEEDFFYILHKPSNFDSKRKYPLLVEVYSGPGYQKAVDRYSFGYKDYVASSLDVIVMSFDGRGTGYRGDHIMHQVYMKLGQYEPLDQIHAVKELSKKFSFIDTSRTAIWGWSYGGYATTRTIESDVDRVFKCGMAVAPVTDWTFYHSIYTERYMKTPNMNPIGYELSTALQQSENLAAHRYAVLHGTRDENVHFQNAARLQMYLVEQDVDFEAFFFANNDHGMSNTANNYNTVYKILTRELQFCFDQESIFGDSRL